MVRKTSQNLIKIISKGPLPKAVAFVLIPKSAYFGTFEDSTNYFKPQGLDTFDLRLDGQPISSYPLQRKQQMYHTFYHKFLMECNQLSNPFSPGSMKYEDFVGHNFMIVENLNRRHITQGDLSVYMRFNDNLLETLYLVCFAIDTRTIEFDEFLNVTITNAIVKEEDEC